MGWAAGLSSPYEYLWSLPVRTRDPDLSQLAAVLDGEDAPTWLVVWGGLEPWSLDADRHLRPVVYDHYRVAGRGCGSTLLVHESSPRKVEQPICT